MQRTRLESAVITLVDRLTCEQMPDHLEGNADAVAAWSIRLRCLTGLQGKKPFERCQVCVAR